MPVDAHQWRQRATEGLRLRIVTTTGLVRWGNPDLAHAESPPGAADTGHDPGGCPNRDDRWDKRGSMRVPRGFRNLRRAAALGHTHRVHVHNTRCASLSSVTRRRMPRRELRNRAPRAEPTATSCGSRARAWLLRTDTKVSSIPLSNGSAVAGMENQIDQAFTFAPPRGMSTKVSSGTRGSAGLDTNVQWTGLRAFGFMTAGK
jgi:hypothetical protein